MIIIQKALGRENIDEVIKLSEEYRNQESALPPSLPPLLSSQRSILSFVCCSGLICGLS